MQTARFSDLVDLEQLQKYADSHYLMTEMPFRIVDAFDDRILAGAGWQDLSACFGRTSSDSDRRALQSHLELKKTIQAGTTPAVYSQDALMEMALPILVEGQLLASLVVGRFFYEEDTPNREFFIKLAEDRDCAPDQALLFLDAVPRFSHERVRQILECYTSLIALIADMAAKTLRQGHAEALSGSPDGISDLGFEDLFDLDEVQKIQDAFAEATGVASIITDIDGRPLTRPSRFCHLCIGIIRQTEKGLANCIHSDAMLGRMNPDGPIMQPCLSGGLWDGGTSICVGDRHIANWLIGQVLDDAIDTEAMMGYARTIGADEEAFREALGGVTRMSHERFGEICKALFLIARQLSQLALKNVQQAREIARRIRAEDERKKLELQIQHAQKLESLGVLAGGIAHDFNNLLMAILGHADLALQDLSPVSPVCENLREIERASRRAAGLCQQMLAYSGKGKFVVQVVDLGEAVEEMNHMLEVSISKKVVLRHHFAPSLPPIEADVSQLRQIIMNLVVNASEAIGEKSGVVAVSTGAMECDRAYLSETWLDENLAPGLYVYLEVADTGCGMTRETLSKIFDPFFTTKFTGRGLGLAAVLGIVRGHRGAIKVYSEPGKGTTFKILFPASRRPVHRLRDKPVRPGWQSSGIVLLVDDEETIRALGKQMLERFGFTVQLAADGREAVNIFRQDPNRFVLVLLDLTMPHLDGEQTFREMRRIRPDVCVIISSGYNEQEVSQRFVGKGLAGFIQKPYQLSVLEGVLKSVLGKPAAVK